MTVSLISLLLGTAIVTAVVVIVCLVTELPKRLTAVKEIDFSWAPVLPPRQAGPQKNLRPDLQWTLMHIGVPAAALGALLLIAFVLASLASSSIGSTTPPPIIESFPAVGAYWYAVFAAFSAAAVVVGDILLKRRRVELEKKD